MQLVVMKILYILFVTLSLKGCLSKDLFKDPTERIVGGYRINITDAPYQVCIMHRILTVSYIFICGGSLITNSMVLTAGHCLVRKNVTMSTSDIRVFAGITILSNLHIYSDVWWFIVHPEYRHENKELWNDIALIKLLKNFQLSAAVKPIALRSVPVTDGTSCKVSGWGTSNSSGVHSKELMAAIVPIYNKQKCSSAYELGAARPLPNGTICAGYDQGGIDACKGDSGGPLVCDGTLTGIVSYGMGCGEVGYPGVYTEVYQYMNWIESPGSRSNKTPPPRFYVSSHVLVAIILLYFFS